MSETEMAYFDKTKQTELITDASPFGLSAILTQKGSGSVDRKVDTVKRSVKLLLLCGLSNVCMYTCMEDILP